MKKKIAKAIKSSAMKATKRSVGKSGYTGIHEIDLPPELKAQIQTRRQSK